MSESETKLTDEFEKFVNFTHVHTEKDENGLNNPIDFIKKYCEIVPLLNSLALELFAITPTLVLVESLFSITIETE